MCGFAAPVRKPLGHHSDAGLHCRVTVPLQGYSTIAGLQYLPNIKFSCTHLYTWVKKGTLRVKCLVQEHNAVPWLGFEPRLPDLELRALTIMPLHLPHKGE